MKKSALVRASVIAAIVLCLSQSPSRSTEEPRALRRALVNAFPAADLLLARPSVPVIRQASLNPETPRLRAAIPASGSDLNIFSSVAIPTGSTAATRKWHAAINPEFDLVESAFATSGLLAELERAAELPDFEAIDLVNRLVNRSISYEADVGDDWSTPMETIRRGTGDCEDYAILKQRLLMGLSFSDEQMQMVVLKDRRRGMNHAVLAIHLDSGTYILDSLTNQTASDTAFRNYVPLLSFIGQRTYIHGFDRTPTTVALAAAR